MLETGPDGTPTKTAHRVRMYAAVTRSTLAPGAAYSSAREPGVFFGFRADDLACVTSHKAWCEGSEIAEIDPDAMSCSNTGPIGRSHRRMGQGPEMVESRYRIECDVDGQTLDQDGKWTCFPRGCSSYSDQVNRNLVSMQHCEGRLAAVSRKALLEGLVAVFGQLFDALPSNTRRPIQPGCRGEQ